MDAERATHLALLLGRLLASHQKQIALVEDWRGQTDFFIGWECAKQESVLLDALWSLNDFLAQENIDLLAIEQTEIRNIDDWQEALAARSKMLLGHYNKMRQRGLSENLSPDKLFPELEVF